MTYPIEEQERKSQEWVLLLADFYKDGLHRQVLLNSLNPQFHVNPFGGFEVFLMHNDEWAD